MLWLNSAHPEEADRLHSKNLQSIVEETVNNEVRGKKNGSRKQEELSGVDHTKSFRLTAKTKLVLPHVAQVRRVEMPQSLCVQQEVPH